MDHDNFHIIAMTNSFSHFPAAAVDRCINACCFNVHLVNVHLVNVPRERSLLEIKIFFILFANLSDRWRYSFRTVSAFF